MVRNVSDHSVSPVRGRGSPRRRSPSRRERSPAGHRSSLKTSSPVREKPSSRTRSPKRTRSRSPVSLPVREKPSSRTKSPKRTKARSPVSPLPMREKPSSRTRSPTLAKSRSPVSRSPSPQTKRLRRTQAEREAERVSERENERNHGRGGDRGIRRERDPDKAVPSERRERRSGRDAVDNGSSRMRHGHSTSPSDRHQRSRHRSRSPAAAADNRMRDEVTNSRGVEHRDDEDDSVSKMKAAEGALEAKEKQKPSFELSGKLAAETNRVRGVTLLFNEPPDARKPDVRWRLYVFKGGEVLNEPLYVHRQSCYLFGRERRVADIPTDHPSCSKQHAVLQYRQVEKEQPDGMLSKQVRPYVMDLGSTNGTFINDNRVEPQRYYELLEKDTIKFGNSSREYVLLHENSAG
ncbi:unnamed protein product [Ilex paraguariensis]|uniref:FHA domain-containing protein n=1 Tax=Ilex paraguariensis TaxID=185542 RepID=A0ABC8U2F9_9AQUA